MGATLACALAPWLRGGIRVIEPGPEAPEKGVDERAFALSATGTRILRALGVWDALAADARPILDVEVLPAGGGPGMRLGGGGWVAGPLGHTVSARALVAALRGELRRRGVGLEFGARVGALAELPGRVGVMVESAQGRRSYRARLVAGADGARSAVRQGLGIESRSKDYGHRAIVARVHAEPAPESTAWEFVTPGGPLALLPGPRDWNLIWSQPTSWAETLLALPEERFLERVQAALGTRLRVTGLAQARGAYPLARCAAERLGGRRGALLGNAAHTLHPIGAQGLSLGLRDAAELAEQVSGAVRAGSDIGGERVIASYAARRASDHRQALLATDALARLLEQDSPYVAELYAQALRLFDRSPGLKGLVARLGTGGLGATPRLARGLPL